MGITPDQFKQLEDRVSQNSKKRPLSVTPVPPSPVSSENRDIIFVCLDRYTTHEFTYYGKPIGKPRMTRRDVWKKRPIVLRYRKFADEIRAASGKLPSSPDMVVITAWMPMPKSWSRKKRDLLNNRPCRTRPDVDNVIKAVMDALFDEDCGIWVGVAIKYWCPIGQERLEVKLLYAKPE